VVDAYVAEIVSTPDQVRQWVVSVRDVTDKLATERELQIAATVMANAAEGIIVTDQENRVIQVNPAFTRITGFTAAEILGRDPKVLRSGRHDPEFFSAMRESLQQTGRWEGEIWNRRRDGSVYPQWLSITALGDAAAGNGVRHVATFIDITQRKEAEELLRHRANTDPLTELSNRALFYDRLQMALTLSRRYGHQFALIYVDLDHFKAVNDSLGHAAGDELLVEAARRLSLVVRESDTVARLGGDEFAVILPEIRQQAEVVEVAQRIVHTLARPFHLGNEEVRVSGSVGVALYPEHGEDLERLKRHADLALYQVKAAGRNGYRIYTAGDGQSLAG
jgi:diguanylate cyclase (GGDEF)-like protein/PAS domain S-box-containing protein